MLLQRSADMLRGAGGIGMLSSALASLTHSSGLASLTPGNCQASLMHPSSLGSLPKGSDQALVIQVSRQLTTYRKLPILGPNGGPLTGPRGSAVLETTAAGPLLRSSFSSNQGDPGPVNFRDLPPMIISPMPCRVVVIGWMGARKSYIAKYGQLWQQTGENEVLILRPTVAQTLLRFRGVVRAGEDIDRVARLHIDNAALPTIYHIFSNGGFIHAGTMWRWMDEVEDVMLRRDLLEDVAGIVIDSAPAQVTPDMAARAVASVMLNEPANDPRASSGPFYNIGSAFFNFWLERDSIKKRTEEVYEAWYNRAPYCPQLYLYSDADPLVPTSEVERYMKIQESRGVEVSSYKWPDSGHCEHYRKHPHDYAYQISQFMSKCLKDW